MYFKSISCKVQQMIGQLELCLQGRSVSCHWDGCMICGPQTIDTRQLLLVWGHFPLTVLATYLEFHLNVIVLCYSGMHPNAACDWWKMDACKAVQILPYPYLDSHSKVMHPEYSKHWRYLLASTIHLLICTWFLKNQFEKIKFDKLDF